jgi:phosphoribosyl 1,2-cyclic phosphodiesterase
VKFAQATDLGKVTTLVRESLRGCQAVVLEANHDRHLLQECGYPWELKQRIASAQGHLSNDDAARALAEITPGGLRHVVLGHLSENSNDPQTALAAMQSCLSLADFQTFICAAPDQPTPWIVMDGREEVEIDSAA